MFSLRFGLFAGASATWGILGIPSSSADGSISRCAKYNISRIGFPTSKLAPSWENGGRADSTELGVYTVDLVRLYFLFARGCPTTIVVCCGIPADYYIFFGFPRHVRLNLVCIGRLRLIVGRLLTSISVASILPTRRWDIPIVRLQLPIAFRVRYLPTFRFCKPSSFCDGRLKAPKNQTLFHYAHR